MLSETRRSAAPPFRALAANRSAASTQVPISVEMQIFPLGAVFRKCKISLRAGSTRSRGSRGGTRGAIRSI